jgi:hypothetical protein
LAAKLEIEVERMAMRMKIFIKTPGKSIALMGLVASLQGFKNKIAPANAEAFLFLEDSFRTQLF